MEMTDTDPADCDTALLRRFCLQASQDACAGIVARYLNLVYASALRQVNEPGAAEDVTQAVFIVLARRAHTVRDGAALPAWLLAVTRYAARDSNKRWNTRLRHERESAAMMNRTDARDWDALSA